MMSDYRAKLRKDPLQTVHFITLSEVINNISDQTNDIVILPPASGDMDIPSDEEHIMKEGDHVEDVVG